MAKTTAKYKPVVKNWYKDRYQYVLLQKRILAVITIASLVCTLGAILVILNLVPQKSVEPYVIQVDPKTGITQAVDPASSKELLANRAVNDYFIVQYIRAREGYASTNIVQQYNIVRLMSEPRTVYAQFQSEAEANNPNSSVARFGSVGKRDVQIKSISYIEPQVAQVRVLLMDRNNGINIDTQTHKLIVLKFQYVKMELSKEDRYLNPLGFRVTDYNVYDEVAE